MQYGSANYILRLLLTGLLFFVLTACGDSPDEDSPVLTLVEPPSSTRDGNLSLTGIVEAGASLEVKIGDVRVTPSLGEAGAWQALLSLAEGSNIIVVTARDSAGNTNSFRRTIVLDTTPPVLVSPAENAAVPATALILVFNEAVDAATISATLNGSPVELTRDKERASTFSGGVSIPSGEYTLVLPAGIADLLGNASGETTRRFTVSQPD